MDVKMNEDTKELLSTISGIAEEEPELLSARENEIYLKISEAGFEDITPALAERKFSLIGLFCAEVFENTDGFTLFYAFKQAGKASVLVLVREPGKEKKSQLGCRNFPFSLLV